MDSVTSNRFKEYLETGRRARLRHDHIAALAAFEAAEAIDPLNSAVKVERARELRALNRIDEATILLDGVLDAEPGHIGALIERGHVRRRQSDHEGAAAAFKAAAAADPKNRNIQIELARDLRMLGRLDEANAVINTILDLEPGQIAALIERGHIYRRRGDHAGAVTAFNTAMTAEPHNRNIQVELARDLRALGRLDEAEVVLGKVLEAEPSKVAALIERGLVLRRRRDHAEAVAAFKLAVAAEPHNRNIQVELARDLRALGRLDEADAVLSRVLDAEPRQFGALVERGHVQRGRGDHAGALTAFEAAAATNPLVSALQLEIVTELRALGRLRDAEIVLRKLINADPNNLPAIVRLSHLMLDTNKLDEADRLLKDAHRNNPNDHRIIGALGHLAHRRGNHAAALHYFRSATEADPANPDLKLNYAAELREQGYLDEALGLLRSVLSADANHWAAWMQLGQYYRAKDNPQSAIEAFETAINKQPHQTQGLVDLALEYSVAGHSNEAEQLLQRALAQEPTHLGALIVSADRALLAERTDEASELAQRAVQLHPGQLGPYLIAARAAASKLNRTLALSFLDQAREIFGSLPDIAATQIHILRQYRDHNSTRFLIENTSEQAITSFSFWMESTSFAITVGDFKRAERALEFAPAKSSKELARVHFMRAHLAEGRRQYAQAIASYQEALSLDPRNGGWHSEMARACLLQADINGVRAHLKAAFSIDRSTKVTAGQSLNISQHHTGQLLDEFTIDSALLARLKEVITLPLEKKIEALKQSVRENPDYTSPALLLLLAMRQSGIFSLDEKTAPSNAVSKIPQKIIQFWNTEVPPPDVNELIESWRTNHNDYTHLLFNDESAGDFLAAHYPYEVCLAFRRAEQPAQRADIFRLAYLASEGGYYIDVDDLCLARLDTFAPAYAEMVGYQENYATIANNFIGAKPHHPVVERALKLAVEAVNRGDHDIVWLSTGPGLLTRAFAQIAAEAASDDFLSKAVVLELWEAQRFIGLHCPVAYKNTEQHWSRAVFRRQPANKARPSPAAGK